jgi:hypothetical protein
MSGSEWKQINGDEWQRGDGVRLVRNAEGRWQIFTVAGEQFFDSFLDSLVAQRLCDFGAFVPDVLALYEPPDPAGIPALQAAILHLHGLEATWLHSESVHEQHEGETVWQGDVQVFSVWHPKAEFVYAWSHETEGGKRRFHAVLGVKPVDGAVMAVRTAVLSTPI